MGDAGAGAPRGGEGRLMCGFVAVLSPAPIALEELDSMRDRLAHRGPDGARSWIGRTPCGYVGLGHRRLSIIDLSAAADQPMWSHDRKLAIVYNGEIYNYIELRAELEARGSTFITRSDTEVLLEAYAVWGLECLSRLNGMFAFAIWDGRRNELFVARDRFGEKPLFSARLPDGGIAFASEMKALFAHPKVRASADESAVATYVAGSYFEETETTLFDGVRRVPAAHAIAVAPTGEIVRSFRFWTPDYTAIHERYDEREASARFRKLLERSVRMRLRSDVPVGTSLSGGLDSSLIVALLAEVRDAGDVLTQNTFSGRFDDDPTLSEGPQIDAVVEATGAHPHFVTPSPEQLIAESERLHWHQEEPFLSASIYVQWCVMRLANEHRTTVLLDGQGADELLAGYQSYFPTHQLDLLDRKALLTAVTETYRFQRRLRRTSRLYPDSSRRFDERVALSHKGLLKRSWRTPAPSRGPYDVGVPPAVPGMRLRRQLAEALQYNSLPALLRYADRNAMAFSRETRFPFLDHELVDWSIGLPNRALIHAGWQKYIVRRAADGLLPKPIAWRVDKVGYAAPLDVWLRGALLEWAHDALFAGPVRDVAGYDSAELRRLWAEHQEGRSEHSWALWRWISLGEWLRLQREGAWKRGVGVAAAPRAAVGN
jgi:asparagine synthase (glutamine-hydrolysing)